MWTTMRFPGQQYDEETDFFSNNHRFYNPSVPGQYLQPEPLLHSSEWTNDRLRRGSSPPIYGYAYNNALNLVDPSGLAGTCGPGGIRCATTASGEISEAGWGGAAAAGAAAGAAGAAAGAAASSNADNPPRGVPFTIPIPIGCSPGPNDDCDSRRNDMVMVCKDAYLERGLGTLLAAAICKVCTESSLLECKGKPPSKMANMACEKLMGRYGGFPP